MEKEIPPGSIVLNRQPTVWESYKWYIISGIFLILFEALLIGGLVWQRARRWKAEADLAITYDRLHLAMEASASVGWDFDGKSGRNVWFGDDYRYLIANRKFLSQRNMTKEQVVGRLVPEVLNEGVFETVVKEKLDECFRGKVVRYEMRYTYPELGERDLLISDFPIEGSGGIDRVACILHGYYRAQAGGRSPFLHEPQSD
jgi:PAS domain-containing protein